MVDISRRRFTLNGATAAATNIFSPAVLAKSSQSAPYLRSNRFMTARQPVDFTRPGQNPRVTVGYEELEKKYHLDQHRRKVCGVSINGDPWWGSGVLVDASKGYIALCAHEVYLGKYTEPFNPAKLWRKPFDVFFNPVDNGLCRTQAVLCDFDRDRDAALARIIDPDFVTKHSLSAVTRQQFGFRIDAGKPMVCLGSLDGKLHAVEAQSDKYIPSIEVDKKIDLCMVQAVSSRKVRDGLSGALMVGQDDVFAGIHSNGDYDHIKKQYTLDSVHPDVIWSLVDACEQKSPMSDNSRLPEECRVNPNRRNLVFALGKN